jgi:hypothetical protein
MALVHHHLLIAKVLLYQKMWFIYILGEFPSISTFSHTSSPSFQIFDSRIKESECNPQLEQ